MVNRFSYEFKIFKSGKRKGKTYVNVRSVKTGKVIKTVSSVKNIKNARRNVKLQQKRAEKAHFKSELEKVAEKRNVSYESLKTRYDKKLVKAEKEERERVKRLKKKGKNPKGRKSKNVKKDVIKRLYLTSGLLTVFTFSWRVKIWGDSPIIEAQDKGHYDGDVFNEVVEDVENIGIPILEDDENIPEYNIVEGSGSCVRLLDRETGRTLRRSGLGAGCVAKYYT